ncbi:hypothetical protein [Campylobacter suis]|uniref:Mobilization protein n=1 Tax=Campylobacter suis TaxID=2790657 RepID=A0ABM8Q8Y2_9BACT|nr:hypothetical protein [Campylobacter suis]CAD7289424.1 hypothetical protein LMG8286_01805 [Campylobacter suis]
MAGLKIDKNEVVLSVRSEFLTLSDAVTRYRHNVREKKHSQHINYLRSSSLSNRYIVLSEYNDNGNMREIDLRTDQNFNDDGYIKELLSCWQDKFIKDYEAQSSTYKNGRVVKNRWRDNMVGFNEFIITFGTDRKNRDKEGLNSNFINATITLDRVIRFINDYCAKFNVKCLLIAEHNDEKTKHYQIITTNYNFNIHKNIRFDGKAKTSEFGSLLQDMGAKAFDGIAARGVKGSKTKNKNLKQMHQTEREFKSEQEFKLSIQKSVSSILKEKLTHHKSLLGNNFYKIDENQFKGLIASISSIIYKNTLQNINIITQQDLKNQIDELTTTILQNEARYQNAKELEIKNKDLQDKLSDKINQDEEIENLKNKVSSQKQAILTLQNKIKDDEPIITQANEYKNELQKLKTKISQEFVHISEHESVVQELEANKAITDIANSEKSNVQNLSKENEEYKEKNKKLSSDNSSLQSEIKKLSNEVNALRNFKSKVMSFIDRVKDMFPCIKKMFDSNVLNERKDSEYSMGM